MPWELPEHAAEREADNAAAEDEPADAEAPSADSEADASADEDRRSAAIDEAVSRLSRLGTLDAVAEATLVATLHNTQPEDWPVVIEEFAAVLSESVRQMPATDDDTADDAAAGDPQAASVGLVLPKTSHLVAKADLTAATGLPTPSAPPVSAVAGLAIAPEAQLPEAQIPEAQLPEPQIAEAEAREGDREPVGIEARASDAERAADAGGSDADPAGGIAASPGAALRIRNACFASRVQAWGVVDRFPADRFPAGREVIVYFELDDLTSQPAATGHTTCIDTVLRLVDAAGVTLHEWNFEPLAETCAGRRRDYFARYVVRIPAALPPGACHLDVLVTDTLADTRAEATLPLEILAATVPGEG